MDNQSFHVMRLEEDYTVVRVWWFAATSFRGMLVLERYQEYHIAAWSHSGDHEYRLAEEASQADGTIDRASAGVPADVMREAASKVRSAVN
jgi:hypothetical protein